MIYLELFLGFLKVGLFSFGGAYGAIPLIRDIVLSYGWLDDEMLTYMIAVSESTPGPIMVNLATYVGSSQAGLPGSAIATFAVILPAFIIILLIMVLLRAVLQNAYPCNRSVHGSEELFSFCRTYFPECTGVHIDCVPVGGILRFQKSDKNRHISHHPNSALRPCRYGSVWNLAMPGLPAEILASYFPFSFPPKVIPGLSVYLLL